VVEVLRTVLMRSAPYSIYPNRALRRFMTKCINYRGDSHPRPLIIAATNYTTAALAGFYSSPLVGKLKDYDFTLPEEDRRLQHLESIEGEEAFFDALLASCAIPVAFPPVKIGKFIYIDGGIGNNTPTREAAYFLRRLAQAGLGVPGEVFCVTQDTACTLDADPKEGCGDIIRRSWDVYYTVHTRPIVDAWNRINDDVTKQVQKLKEVKEAIAGMPLAADVQQQIVKLIDDNLQPKQQDFPITFIQPTTALGDTLDFSAEKIKERIRRGYFDFLKTMYGRGRLTPQEKGTLDQTPIFRTPPV
jgi:hypothetical protein